MLINPYALAVAGGGPGGGPAAWASIVPTAATSTSTSHSLTLPATIEAGDLILLLVSSPLNTVSGFSGFTSVAANIGPIVRLSVLYKIADGSEGGASVGYTSASSVQCAALAFRFLAGTFNPSDPVVVSSATAGSSDTHSPPDLSLPWGAVNSFVMGFSGTRNIALDADTIDYCYPVHQAVSHPASGSGNGYTTGIAAGALEDSGTATPGDNGTPFRSRIWSACTLGIRPPS